MEKSARDFRNCPQRKVRSIGESQHVVCELLERLLPGDGYRNSQVTDEACGRCALFDVPDRSSLNPAFASLVYDLTNQILGSGCSDTHLSRTAVGNLQHWAMQHLRVRSGSPPNPPVIVTRQPCRFRGAHWSGSAEPCYECQHDDHPLATEDICQLCPDWETAGAVRGTRLIDVFPTTAGTYGPEIRTWSVGVITTFRDPPTLGACLDSLIRAGFRYPRIFMDGQVEIASRHRHLPVTLREPRVRSWANWYLGLQELLMRDPDADAYLMCEDDALFYDGENLREFLESSLWPFANYGPVSLYCSSADTQATRGWHQFSGIWQWGAVALVFSRELAKAMVSDRQVLEHRWAKRNDGCANIDTEVGIWAHRHSRPVCFPTPSLVQHIGDASTLWPTARAIGARCANTFVGDLNHRAQSWDSPQIGMVLPADGNGT